MRDPRVAVIGAGMSGICAAARLRQAGIENFVVYEKAEELGGTWRDNTYPGLSCDVPSRYYSYTFAPNPDWTRLFSPGAEIHAYLCKVAEDLDLVRHIRFSCEVDQAEWTKDGDWRLRTKDGAEDAFDFIVAASGVLHHPRMPDIPGLDSYGGAVFHSARWNHSVPLDGRRVGVIGTGSTGVQITRALSPRCAEYKLFQRTPQWVFPIPNPRYRAFTRSLLRRWPALNRVWGRLAYRFWQRVLEHGFCAAVMRPGLARTIITAVAKAHLYVLRDRPLRGRMHPGDQPMCKRMIFASGFYQKFQSGRATLVDTDIDHVCEKGIVTTDGLLHELDVIVLATGFHAHTYLQPVELIGLDGVRLSKVWGDEPRGYRTVALPGFPNFFVLLGPHSPIGNQSLFMITETQVDYALRWIEDWRDHKYDWASPRDDATETFNDQLRGSFGDTIWVTGCQSWYLGKDGLPALWPFSPQAHRDMLATLRPEEWVTVPD